MPTKTTKNIKITENDGRKRIAVTASRKQSVSAKIASTKRKPRVVSAAKASSVPSTSGRIEYRDPVTGKHWTGFGKKPAWAKPRHRVLEAA